MGAFTGAAAGGREAAIFAASDVLLSESTGEESTNSHSYVKIKAIKVPELTQNSTFRVTFTIKNQGTYSTKGQIYKNGAAIGTERTNSTETYNTYSEDLAGFDTDDEIQLYIRKTSGVNNSLTDNLSVRGVIDSTADPEWEVIT